MKIRNISIFAISTIIAFVCFSSCEKVDEPTPTNQLMEGIWKATNITDANGVNITDTVTSWFPAFIHLDGNNSVNSTCGPLFMYIVYGKSRFINVASKIDEVFSYANIQLTEGEWFIDKNKVVNNFTVEMKMRFPTAQTLSQVFQIFNLKLPEFAADALDFVIYHRFKNIIVKIDDKNKDKMIWQFNEDVVADYNTKNKYGDKVAYEGISPTSFSKCTIVFEKQTKSITELTQQAVTDGYGKPVN